MKIILEINKIYNEDCLEGMKKIDDKSIDMILCDLPYGTTACKWDTIIPMKKFVKTTNRQGKFIIQYENEYIVNQLKITDKSYLYIRDEFNEKAENGLWEHYERIIKDNGAIVLCGSQPFTAELIHSNLKGYKYNWVWEKSKASNFIQVKNQPLKNYEDVCVFTANGETSNYYPQMTDGEPYKPRAGKKETEVYNTIPNHMFRNGSDGKRYPKAIQYFKTSESEGKVLHPTQKPVALFEYLIRTYTNEGETVLDNCMGSGTTAIACINTKRNYIGFEKDTRYYNLANQRILDT